MRVSLNNNVPVIGGSFTNEVFISRWEEIEDSVIVYVDVPPNVEKLHLDTKIYGTLDSIKIKNIVRSYYENNRIFIDEDFYAPLANWDGFNTQMLSDPEFNHFFMIASQSAPVLGASLPAALSQVSNGQLTMFQSVWEGIMNISGASQTHRDKWGQWAIDNNLPTKFINIIKGDI